MPDDLRRARKQNTEILGGRPFGKNGILFIKFRSPCAKAGQHGDQVLILDLIKQRAFS
jgi:hypothetical protein